MDNRIFFPFPLSPTSSARSLMTQGWQGNLELVYIHENQTTKLKHNLATSPLKIQRSFYPENKAICHNIILHTAGGIVGGDRLLGNITLQENAQALITTAAAAKVYGSNGQIGRQKTQINIASGAILEWLPQETIIFNGAKYEQDLRVDLATDAYWLSWDITRFGRTARGEKFLEGNWYSHTEIWQQGKPLWIDSQWLPGNETIWFSPHGLNNCPIIGTFIAIGKPISREIINQVRHLWELKHSYAEVGVTKTQGEGLLCRYRGESTTEVRNWFMEIWHLLRGEVLQRDVIKPRVWQI